MAAFCVAMADWYVWQTSDRRDPADLWETARYDIYPRFLRMKGVARINLVGGRVPENHVILDPTKLARNDLSYAQVTQALSVFVLGIFLGSAEATLVAVAVIPVTVLLTLVGLRVLGMSFNLMILGGIAAVVGIVIDDAIVVVEAIHTKIESGCESMEAARLALIEVGPALLGSTLTPVVVFIPLAFLDGVAGVFFRSLAVTMVVALLISLILAVSWTPITGGLLMGRLWSRF